MVGSRTRDSIRGVGHSVPDEGVVRAAARCKSAASAVMTRPVQRIGWRGGRRLPSDTFVRATCVFISNTQRHFNVPQCPPSVARRDAPWRQPRPNSSARWAGQPLTNHTWMRPRWHPQPQSETDARHRHFARKAKSRSHECAKSRAGWSTRLRACSRKCVLASRYPSSTRRYMHDAPRVKCHRHLQKWITVSSACTRRRDCVFKRRRTFLGASIMRGGDMAVGALPRTMPCVDSQQRCGPGAGNLEILNRCVWFAAEAARNPWHLRAQRNATVWPPRFSSSDKWACNPLTHHMEMRTRWHTRALSVTAARCS